MAYIRTQTRELSYQPIPFYIDRNPTRSSLKPCFKLDLNSLCIKRPSETFFIQVKNPNLLAWGIETGDLLVVEQTSSLLIEDLLVIEKNGEYQLYQFFNEIENSKGETEKILFSLDVSQPNLRVKEWNEVTIAGVITNVVHQMRKRIPRNETRYTA